MPELRPNSNLNAQVAAKMLATVKGQQDKPKDAVKLLKADHDEALELYDKFFDAEDAAEKQALAAELCLALSVHMRIEEDIFYPAVNLAVESSAKTEREDKLIVPEARLEHASLKKLISEVEASSDDIDFEAHVQVMCEYTKHHAKEEEKKMFPEAKDCDLDLDALGRQLLNLKVDLLEGMAEATDSASPPLPSSLFERPTTGTGFALGNRT
jgi:hypothetical protein